MACWTGPPLGVLLSSSAPWLITKRVSTEDNKCEVKSGCSLLPPSCPHLQPPRSSRHRHCSEHLRSIYRQLFRRHGNPRRQYSHYAHVPRRGNGSDWLLNLPEAMPLAAGSTRIQTQTVFLQGPCSFFTQGCSQGRQGCSFVFSPHAQAPRAHSVPLSPRPLCASPPPPLSPAATLLSGSALHLHVALCLGPSRISKAPALCLKLSAFVFLSI